MKPTKTVYGLTLFVWITMAQTAWSFYNPSTGRWLSRDPIGEAGFYLLTIGHQASENSSLTGGDTPNQNDFLTANGPNVYAFVDNDPAGQIDYYGLIIVAFYGADYWGSGENGGANPEIRRIAEEVRSAGFTVAGPYRSLDIWDPYQYLLSYFRNGDGSCNDDEPIKIFGHSWGATSAVKLSRWLGRSELRNHEIDVYTIDAVHILRLPPTSVPSSVTYFWNRYQTHGGPVLGHIALHGSALVSHAKLPPDQKDLNPGPLDNGIDHLVIVRTVKVELIEKLEN